MPGTSKLEELKKMVADLSAAVQSGGDQDKLRAGLRKILKKSRAYASGPDFDYDVEDGNPPVRCILQKRMLRKEGDSLKYITGTNEQHAALQQLNDDVYILSKILGVSPTATRLFKGFRRSELAKALSHAVGLGAEWIPTGFSADMIDRVVLELEVANLHRWIPMPSNPFTFPMKTAGSTAYLVAENTADHESASRIPTTNVATDNVTLTAIKLGARSEFSTEVEEDSIVPVLPMIKEDIQRAMKEAIENATINGDTSSPHMDSDVTSSTDARKAWDGYRDRVQAAAKVSLATFNVENIRAIRKVMGKYGVKPSQIAYVTGFSGYSQLLSLKDSSSNQVLLTMDKYGANATILSGELGRLDGSPVIVSEFIRQNLNASGVYDGTTMTKTILLVIYRPGLMFGDRRKVTMKTDENIDTDQMILVITQRLAFQRRFLATETFLGLGHNITT